MLLCLLIRYQRAKIHIFPQSAKVLGEFLYGFSPPFKGFLGRPGEWRRPCDGRGGRRLVLPVGGDGPVIPLLARAHLGLPAILVVGSGVQDSVSCRAAIEHAGTLVNSSCICYSVVYAYIYFTPWNGSKVKRALQIFYLFVIIGSRSSIRAKTGPNHLV